MPEPSDRYRCSVASEQRGESLTATASTVSCFLLLEEPGPWGPDVLRCYRLPDAIREQVAIWQSDLGLRPLLIRRHGRSKPEQRRVFVVNARHGWVQTALVDDLDDVATWDLSLVRTPAGVGLRPWTDPILLVCTHGRHDACCAERGRPVAKALTSEFGELVWESSHLGGDRFAGNLLVLPSGDCYGRLDATTAVPVASAHLAGTVTLEHHRGRSTVPWVAQAAERAVRERLGESALAAVTSRVLTRTDDTAIVEVTVRGAVHLVEVTIDSAAPAMLTCKAEQPAKAPRYNVSE